MTSAGAGLKRLLEAFERLRIPFLVGGSLASSIHGIARATQDIDIVADLALSAADALAEELGGEFHAGAEMIREALLAGIAFNVIHIESSYKFDIFPLRDDPYYRQEFERRKVEETAFLGEPLRFPVATAEDTVLTKLVWYRASGRVSERQWNDVLGLIRIQKDRLDAGYLRRWARHLGVEDLLEKVFEEAGQRLLSSNDH